MPCFHPLTGYPQPCGGLTFNRNKSLYPVPIKVPCGQCIGCRLERSRQWAIRCVHEGALHDHNSFITLTYDDKHLPPTGTLVKAHFQKFIKRLRKQILPLKIRYYHCGEYGDKLRRPHYHAIIFGYAFPDRQLFKDGKNKLYTSTILEKCWTAGFSTIGDLTFETAAYTARYIMKKVNGKNADHHYRNIDKTTGEYWQIQPEYTTMSRRPGIAADWFKRYSLDCYPSDFITIKGRKMKPPKYYDRLFEHDSPEIMQQIKAERLKNRILLTDKQLADKKAILQSKLATYTRNKI